MEQNYSVSAMDAQMVAEKMKAMQAQLAQDGAQCGASPVRKESLRERLADRVSRADRESRKTESMRELAYKLDKNPEVARILELMEECAI